MCLVKLVCLHCTITVPHVYWTIKSYNLKLKVDFKFQSFLVITVYIFILTSTESWYCRLWCHISCWCANTKGIYVYSCCARNMGWETQWTVSSFSSEANIIILTPKQISCWDIILQKDSLHIELIISKITYAKWVCEVLDSVVTALSQAKEVKVPVKPVWYWRQSSWGIDVLPHSNCLTLNLNVVNCILYNCKMY